jgi:phage terminase small subunit
MPGTFRSGRHRKPTALHVLDGSRIRDRKHEPQYEPGIPECPVRLAGDTNAKAVWDLMAARLQASGVLTVAHGEALTLLAEAWADYARLRDQLRVMSFQPLIVEELYDPTGTKLVRRRVRENPLTRRSERLALLCSRLLGEFGMTPVTAARIAAKRPAVPDAFEAFLGGGRPRMKAR